jgi:putative membrane protein
LVKMTDAGLSASDHARISDAIRAAESGTAGEIYVVVARMADDFQFVPVVWAALSALLIPWPLYLFTALSSGMILLLQAAFFVLTAVALSHPALRHRLVPSPMAAEAARKSAQALFMAHGVHLTEQRTGILIYAALIDRRIEIVADAGINSKVDQATWDELAHELSIAARQDRLPDGLVSVVGRAGALLAAHFPPPPINRNELSDRVVEI